MKAITSKDLTKSEEEQPKLSKAVVDAISKVAADVALQKFSTLQKETAQRRKDNRLRNAKLLVKKYKWICSYGDNAIYEIGQLSGTEEYEILEAFGIDTIEMKEAKSIKNSVAVTKIILRHVNEMLDLYKNRCLNSQNKKDIVKWNCLYAMYLAPETSTPEEIANREYISDRLVYYYIDSACEELSTLFFGIDPESLLNV
jgi:hypothetical protein